MKLSNEVKDIITEYFQRGYNSRLIHYLLERRHGLSIGYHYLRGKVMKILGLRRKTTYLVTKFDDLLEAFLIELNKGQSRSCSDMLATLRVNYKIVINRSVIRELMRIFDSVGNTRRKSRRLKRRQYRNQGPNWVWHLDQYDKLKPFGICISGCIDGFSRKLIWLEAGCSNSDPRKIAGYFINSVEEIRGCPRYVRGDCGTENGTVAALQTLLLDTFHSHLNGSAFLYGKSVHNQRIERFWYTLRQKCTDYWINHFKEMQSNGLLTVGNRIHRMLVQILYLPLIKLELSDVMAKWNAHLIRRQKQGDVISGIPEILYNHPEIFGTENKACMVDSSSREFCWLRETKCDFENGPDENMKALVEGIFQTVPLQQPSTPNEAREIYYAVLPILQNLLAM